MLTPGITFPIIGVAGAVLAREILCSPGVNIIAKERGHKKNGIMWEKFPKGGEGVRHLGISPT